MTLALTQKDLPYLPVPRATVQDHVYLKMKELILNGGIDAPTASSSKGVVLMGP